VNEEYRLLECDAVWLLKETIFRMNVSPTSSGREELVVTVNFVPDSLILSAVRMEAIRSSQTSIITTATRRDIPEDSILHSHRCENFKSYIALTGWAL
jgi:hypothetical protein